MARSRRQTPGWLRPFGRGVDRRSQRQSVINSQVKRKDESWRQRRYMRRIRGR